MKEGVNFITKVDNISVYKDIYMDSSSYLIMYKGEELENPGLIFVPSDIFNEGMKTAKGAAFDQKEVDEILRKKKNRKLLDVKAIICNIEKEDINKLIESLYKNFK